MLGPPLALRNIPTATSVGLVFEAAIIHPCSGSGCARHPDCSYRSASTLSSRGFYVRAYHGSLPPRAPDRFTVRFGQLEDQGTSTLKHSPSATSSSRG